MAAPYSVIDRFIAKTSSGQTLPGASVYVTVPGGGAASLYVNRLGTATIPYPSGLLPNPLTTDANGRVTFYVDPGRYNIEATSAEDGTVYYYDVIASPEDALRAGDLSDGITTIDTWADISSTPVANAGDIFYLKGHTNFGLGGGRLTAFVGSVAGDGGTEQNSATLGFYLKRTDLPFISPEMYGCIAGSSAVTATRAINKAYVYAAANGVPVRYELLTYALDGTIDGTSDVSATGTRGGIQVKSNTVTVFTGQTFTQAATNSDNYSLLNCSNCSNFEISGSATFIGDALIHTGVGGAYGHGLYLANAHDFNISGLTMKTCWGDGLYISCTSVASPALGISTATSNGTISNCVFNQNRRTGFGGINMQDITINRCDFLNTSTLVGAPTSSGVDLETDAVANMYGIHSLTFNDCLMSGNLGPSVQIFGTFVNAITDITFTECRMISSSAQGSYWSNSPSFGATYEAKNLRVNGGVIEGGVYSGANTTFTGVKISRNMTDPGSGTYAIEQNASTINAKYVDCDIRCVGDTTINSKKLVFIAGSGTDLNKTEFEGCTFTAESIYGGAANVLLTIGSPCTFSACTFLAAGTVPAIYFGFDTTPGSSKLTPSFAMLYKCVFDPQWHLGFPGFQNRVDLNVVKVRSMNFIGTNLVPLSAADVFEFIFTGAGASTIANPTDPYPKLFTMRFKNTSAGAVTVPTFGANYKLQAAWVQPAAGQNRSIMFYHDGTNVYELYRTAADVPN